MSDKACCACLRVNYEPERVEIPHPITGKPVEGLSDRWVCVSCGAEFNRVKWHRAVVIQLHQKIEELEALTKADGKEIGSYRKGTGLRGENKRLQKMLDEVEAEVQRLREEKQANGELYKVLSRRMDSIEKHRDELIMQAGVYSDATAKDFEVHRFWWQRLMRYWKQKAKAKN